jgi:hypothetical protein
MDTTKDKAFNDAAADAQGIDPILQENLDDVSTNEPLLPKDDYEVEVVKLTQKRNNADTGNMINIEMKTTSDHKAVDESLVPAGRRIFHRIVITPTEKMNADAVKRNLKRFQVACNGDGNFYPLDQYVGARLTLKLGMSKTTDEYPDERNEVKGFVVPKES